MTLVYFKTPAKHLMNIMALRQSTGGRASIIAAGNVFRQIVLIRSFIVTRRGTSFGVAQSITTEDVVLVDGLPLIVLFEISLVGHLQ